MDDSRHTLLDMNSVADHIDGESNPRRWVKSLRKKTVPYQYSSKLKVLYWVYRNGFS